MRGFGIPAAARASMVLALAIAPAWSPARAATKHTAPSPKLPFSYDTTGVVDIAAAPGSITGPSALQFQNVTGGTFVPGTGQTLQVGRFAVPADSASIGQATTYDHTPFEVQIRTPEFDRTSTVPLLDRVFPKLGHKFKLKTLTENSLLLRGHLTGLIQPNGMSGVTATVDSIRPGGLEPSSKNYVTHYAFPIRFGDFKLPPDWITTTMTTTPTAGAAAQMLDPAPTPAPEPSTIALYAAVLGGLALARRRSWR